MENFYTYAYVSFASTSVVLIIFLLFTKIVNRNYIKAKYYLAVLLGITTCEIVVKLLGAEDLINGEIEILSIYAMVKYTLKSLLIFFMFLSIMHELDVKKKNILKYYILPFCLLFVYLIVNMVFGDMNVYDMEEFFSYLLVEPAMMLRLMFFISMGAAFIVSFMSIRKSYYYYVNNIDNYYADNSELKLKGMMVVSMMILVVGIIGYIYHISGSVHYDLFFYMMTSLMYLTFVIMFVNMFIRSNVAVSDVANAVKMSKPVNKNETFSYDTVIIKEKIESWLESEDKVYLRQGISISDVADSVKVNKRTLSTYINSYYKVNFNTWINSLRIEEVCKLMNSSLSLTEISEKTGFTDLSSMSKIFKKFKGVTLSEYRKNLKY